MSINRKFYFLGFAIYIFSFFLPAVPFFNEPAMGYEFACLMLGYLFIYWGIIDYSFSIVFPNLANILTAIVFVLQFKVPFKKLIIFQSIAFLSSLLWIVINLVSVHPEMVDCGSDTATAVFWKPQA